MSVVVITGTSSGFGLRAAVAYAQQGHTVVATMRDLSRREALENALDAGGTEALLLPLDVTVAASRAAAIDEVHNRFGQVDILVNNAGIAHLGPVDELSDEVFRRMFDTNVFGPTELMRLVLPTMRSAGQGRIVNVTSISAVLAPAYLTAYCATKHALDAVSRGMDLELTPFGIRVVTVAPGGYNTDIMRRNSSFFDPAATAHKQASELADRIRTTIESVDDLQPVTDAILEAGTATNPRIRYVVGDGLPRLAAALVEEGARVHEQLRAHQFGE